MDCGLFYRIRLLYLKEFISAPCMLCDSFILRQCELIPPLACFEILMFYKKQAFMFIGAHLCNLFPFCMVALLNIEIGSLFDEISRSAPECVMMSYLSIEIGFSVNQSKYAFCQEELCVMTSLSMAVGLHTNESFVCFSDGLKSLLY